MRLVFALWIAISLACSAFAQQAPSAALPTYLGDPEISRQPDSVEIQIPDASSIAAQAQVLTGPDRVVIDFPGAEFKQRNQSRAINQAGVRDLRISEFHLNPPVARMVVDLDKPLAHQIENSGGKIIIRLTGSAAASASAPAAKEATKTKSAEITKANALTAKSTAPLPKPSPDIPPPPHANYSPAPAVATSLPAKPVTEPAVLQAITTSKQANAVRVEIDSSSGVQAKLSVVTNPDRIVVDLENTTPGTVAQRVPVDIAPIDTIRVGLHKEKTPNTRIVLDMSAAVANPALNIVGNKLLIDIPAGSAPAKAPAVASKAPEPVKSAPELPKAAPPTTIVKNSPPVTAAPAPDVRHRPSPAPASASTLTPYSAKPSKAALLRESKLTPPDTAAPTPPAAPAPAETTPVRPSDLPPQAPRVGYINGQLTISAQNSALTDILFEISAKTGAQIEMPAWTTAGQERVSALYGPGNPRDILSQLLQGSGFNYVLVESENGLQQVILTPKQDDSAIAQQPPPPPPPEAPLPDATETAQTPGPHRSDHNPEPQ